MPGQHSLYKWSTAFSSAGKTHQKQLRKQPLEVFCKKGVLKSFAIFNIQYSLCWGFFLIQLQALRPATLLKRESVTGVLLWNRRDFYVHLFWGTSANYCFCSYSNVLCKTAVLKNFAMFKTQPAALLK